MSKPKAVIDPNKCRPEHCPDGVCLALAVCKKKLLKQDAPYEVPYVDGSLCQSCFDCLKACPLKAIRKL